MSEKATLDEFTETTVSQERQETSIGKLPTDWGVERLKDVVKINPDGFSEEDWPSETFEYISLSEVSDGIIEDSQTTSLEDAPSRAQRTVQLGDVLVGTVRPKQKSHGFVSEEHDRKICSSGFGVLRPEARLNSRYLLQEILSNRFFSQMEAYVAGSGYPAVKISDLKKHRVAIPPLPEQRNIAIVLYTVDRAIGKTEEIIEQVDTLKSGVVQRVFKEGIDDHESYQKTKSGEIPDEWEVARFEEIIADTRYGTDTKSNTEFNGYPTLRIPNVVNKRITVDDLKYTPLDEDELERLKLKDDDILIIRTNGNPDYVGRCAIFKERDEPFVFASYLIRIRVDESRLRPAYVREFLNSPRGRSEMAGWIRSSAGNYNLSVGSIEKFQIPIPSLEEQDKIIEKITAFENTIEKNRDYRDRLQRLKRGLMQDLLSGTVRTTNTNIEVPEEIAQHG